MKKINFLKNPYVQFILFGLVLATLPIMAQTFPFVKSGYIITIGGTLIYAIAALGLNLLLGYSGLISLGTAGFMGLAAYISAYLTVDLGWPFLASMAVAVIIPTIIGILVGLVSLKIEGMYLAIATLAVSEVIRKTFEEFDTFTNGFSGKAAKFPSFFNISLDRASTYYLIVIVMVLVMILMYNMVNGQLGRALNAMRGSEAASQAMGVNLLKYRLIAFAFATAFAALSGVLYVHFVRYSYPSIWSLKLSLDFLAMIIIGGLRSIYGTIIGAFIIFAVPDIFLKQIPYFNQLSYMFNGILIILVIMFYPNGIVNLRYDIKKWWNKIFSRKGKLNNDVGK
ncbi:MAG: branched-chain amino acid ABC transporter permease [Firmicutes bacterium HGW-Firmicutes-10]|jgi:branched-chain amino acid transport system permease protein|nr:MAG: branched-chain amino acid ABC transporter permease [Firmicutes bacterium HGW-Firmicutes-10]